MFGKLEKLGEDLLQLVERAVDALEEIASHLGAIADHTRPKGDE